MKPFITLLITLLFLVSGVKGQTINSNTREHLLFDFGWRFAFGHPFETAKDYNNGTSYFSYLAKTGFGDGAASAGFDDRSWRKLDLPHDWAVEQANDSKGSFSHGSKAVGRNFPETSVGWYRKKFTIPASDLGRKISIAFDGIARNSIVWVNGHYLGNEPSGFMGFEYDITEYINYGSTNVIAVRADVTMEEGWFYEGAGIYRHAWLNKTNSLHVQTNGIFVTTKVNAASALINAKATIENSAFTAKNFEVIQSVVDATGKTVSSATIRNVTAKALQNVDLISDLKVQEPKLWSIESPYLYKLKTSILENGITVDEYLTTFGIRTIRFDANQGFFLNGKPVKIKGSNNHQDHAGVGAAMPDALQDFRINTLKSMGSNAYRCSHNPPTPELLEACDRLGMLVIDETRLMGINEVHLSNLKKLILRDRNHPSIISWSVGNEEWAIEGNITGARIAATMQAFAKTIDTTRFITNAISGGVGQGISTVIDVMGYNYVATKNTDEHHAKFPWQSSWGTEEGSTVTSRGIYQDNNDTHQLAAYDKKQNSFFLSLEDGWKHYADRKYLAGMFIWTGFDYRGEPTPFGWPSVGSYFGMFDQCGFPKDDVFYLRSWWTDKPTLHLLPHWNWRGKEGQEIAVWAHSNCDEVELFLNKQSLGKQAMLRNRHLEWKVKYAPGILKAVGFKKGVQILTDIVQTTSEPEAIQLTTNQNVLKADREDIALITVDVTDKNNLHHPTATNEISFSLQGPGKIIGVGNGDPTSHEADKFIDSITVVNFGKFKEKAVAELNDRLFIASDYNDSGWPNAFKEDRTEEFAKVNKALVYRTSFTLPTINPDQIFILFYNSIGKQQSVFINGKEVAANINEINPNEFKLNYSLLHTGVNNLTIVASPLVKKNQWDSVNQNAGSIQITTPAQTWKRNLFSGLAQVIIQTTAQPGNIVLTAKSEGLKPSVLTIKSTGSALRPAADK